MHRVPGRQGEHALVSATHVAYPAPTPSYYSIYHDVWLLYYEQRHNLVAHPTIPLYSARDVEAYLKQNGEVVMPAVPDDLIEVFYSPEIILI